MTQDRPYAGTQAVLRAIAVLKVFTDENPEWHLSDLARVLDLNKTTAFRLLTALESEGMIIRRAEDGAYRLGPEVIAMGGRALRSNDLRSVSYSELETLAQSVGEAATLELLVGSETMILEELPSSHVVAPSQSVGTRYPAHATSTGKVLLANLEEDERRELLRRPLTSYTPRTITSADKLEQDLVVVRQQGYAIAVEEFEPDFVAVGVPIRDHNGRVVAAISVGGPGTRLPYQRLLDLVPTVKEAADRISQRIGYQG